MSDEDALIKKLLDKLDYLSKEDKNQIRNAIYYIIEKHKNQFRKSGEPYYIHPIESAIILA
ncbi:MAG TPA: hypothetical protein EYP82_07135, partial [Hydrogenothermaceae bacterium]|nr:hypothetical protein [Hydrogenothermaceae bacterium]